MTMQPTVTASAAQHRDEAGEVAEAAGPDLEVLARADSSGQLNGTVVQAWKAPLPPPSAFRDYNEIVPGSADRILKMAEAEQSHRHSMDRSVTKDASEARKLGQWLGWSLVLVCILAAIFVEWATGATNLAVAFLGAPIITAAVALIVGKLSHGDEGQ